MAKNGPRVVDNGDGTYTPVVVTQFDDNAGQAGNAFYVEAAAQQLAGGATFTGADHTVPGWAARVSVTAMSSQAGTLRLHGSFDGSAFVSVTETALVADTDTQITRPGLGHVAYRAEIENGDAAAVASLSLTYTAA